MKISIASYSFHGLLAEGKIDVFGYLESCKYRYGLDTADLWNGIVGTTNEGTILKVRQEADARGLTIVNYHVDGVHLWEDDPETRKRNYHNALVHLKTAVALGAKTVRIDTGGKIGPASEEQFDYLTRRYSEYSRFAADHGFTVGPENHWGLSLISDTMVRLAQAVEHPGYGILLHLGHWEDCASEVGDAKLAPWAVHTHVDANLCRGHLQERMQIVIDAGYSGYWGVEHHSAQNEYAETAVQVAEVRRVLSRTIWNAQSAQTLNRVTVKEGNPLLTPSQERG